MSLYESLMERMEGRPYNGYFSALCPFPHYGGMETNPSFFVYEESNSISYEFRCASCGKHGSLKYLDKVLGSHFLPATRTKSVVLPAWRKWESRYDDLEGIVYAAHRNLTRYPKFQEYFKKRKIYEFTEEGRLGYLDGWVTFPVRSRNGTFDDIVVRSISRKSDVRYVVSPSEHGGHHSLYVPSWNVVNDSQTVYVVYGIVDSISLHLVGMPVVTGITGKSLSPDLLKPLNKRFIIIPDAGEETEAYKLANKLGWRAKVKEMKYPDGTKDTDDIRRQFGNEYLLQSLGASA